MGETKQHDEKTHNTISFQTQINKNNLNNNKKQTQIKIESISKQNQPIKQRTTTTTNQTAIFTMRAISGKIWKANQFSLRELIEI